MRVTSLIIENFRGVRSGVVHFREHTVLVGANNTGKSTVIEALTLLLGRDSLVRELTEHDFFGSNPQPTDRIKLIATISGFDGDAPEKHTDWFREGRAVPKWFDHQTGTVHPLRLDTSWSLCCQVAVQAYFDSDSLSVEMVRYFHDHSNPIDPFAGDSVVPVPGTLIQQFGYFLVRANRSWDKVLSWGSELFRRTVHVAAAQPSAAILTERDRLRAPEYPIEDDAQIAPLVANVNKELARCMANCPELQLRLTCTDSKSVLDAVAAHFAVRNGPSIPASRQGSGLISLQGLMLLLELGRVRAAAGCGFIMALEEPEIHVSPATQHQLVHRIQGLSTQTFITTHSPSVAALADPTSVLLLQNINGTLVAEPVLPAPLTAASPAWERKLFQQMRVELMTALMHPQVLVPEGRADYFLLRIVLRPLVLYAGWDDTMEHSFGLEVGVVPTEDAKVILTYQALSRLHGNVGCLVDGDKAGRDYCSELQALPVPPKTLLRWNDGAMIEDVIGWILEAGDKNIVSTLSAIKDPAPQSIAQIVEFLKAKKVNIVAYETVADVIANDEGCRARAARLFSDMAAAFKGVESQHFKMKFGVWVFQR